MIKRAIVLVEGQTEETFVKEVLRPYLLDFNVYLDANMVCTKVVKKRRQHRGGLNSYVHIKRDLGLLARDTNLVAITTLFDFYAYPTDAPGMGTMPSNDAYSKVNHLEQCFKADIPDHRFIPFIMLHEFETIVFCEPEKLAYSFPGQEQKIQEVRTITDGYTSPELINDSPITAPSKRLISIFPEYDKILHGCTTALEVGLPTIREKCQHFDSWLSKLESL